MDQRTQLDQTPFVTLDETPRNVTRKKIVFSVFALTAVMAVLAVADLRQQPEHQLVLIPRSTALENFGGAGLRGALNPGNASAAISLSSELVSHCWTFTGETCNIQGCKNWRNAECDNSDGIHGCYCPAGSCTGADYICHPGNYELVAKSFKLTNAYWTSEHLYVPTVSFESQLRVTTTNGDGDEYKFSLWKVHGQGKDGRARYLISSIAFPDYVVSIQPNRMAGSLYKVNVIKPKVGFNGRTLIAKNDPQPSLSFFVACKPKGGSTGVQFGAGEAGPQETGDTWIYIHRFSWMCFGWIQSIWGAPDSRAQWIADPPLDESLIDTCP